MVLKLDSFFEDAFLRYLAYAALFFIIVAVSIPLRRFIQKYQLKKYPSPDDLVPIKKDIRNLLSKNANYATILGTLRDKYSYPKFILEGLIIDVENEEKTQVSDPKRVIKANFNISYPNNWKLKPLDKDLNEEQFFTIEGSYSAMIVIGLANELDLKSLPSLAEINDTFSQQYNHYSIGSSFEKWGNFYGEGNLFSATVLNNTISGKAFRSVTNNYGFYLFLASMDDDFHNVKEGFEMIENGCKLIS